MPGGLPPGSRPSILNGRMGRSGSADLPLHGGRIPEWLASRMARLGTVIVEALLLEEGPHGVLRRLAHPFWFQALGCVLGMDWHSSGITTSVLGALKRGLAGREEELGLAVCGGRGRPSRRTPGGRAARGAQVELAAQPDRLIRELRRIPHLMMPAHHEVRATDVFLRRVHATLAAAAEQGPRDFAELLLQPGVGARTVQALAAVAEVVHG